MYAELLTLVTVVVGLVDEPPDEEDVKAGWPALLLMGLLILAVVFLGFSLVKRLRNVDRAEAEGRYGPSRKQKPPEPTEPTEPTDPPIGG